MVSPYFIWPNVDPFRKSTGLEDAVPRPGGAAALADAPGALSRARRSVKAARAAGLGIFAAEELEVGPFELRFLARREPPNRWVIDLTRDDDRLLPPQKYYRIAFPEDRLYVPSEYVPLFEHKGWRRGRRGAGACGGAEARYLWTRVPTSSPSPLMSPSRRTRARAGASHPGLGFI